MKKLHLNPILRKEFKLGARTFKFPMAIALYSLFFSMVSLLIFISSTNSLSYYLYAGESGVVNYSSVTEGFRFLAIAQIFMICIIVPLLTAGSIAGERERQTLDIMLTAPVHSFSIAWGKLMAGLGNVLIFIISALPAMSICFLYGGIKWRYLVIFIIQIMGLAFFVGSVGVWASAFFKKTIVAVIITLILEMIFFGLPVVIYGSIYVIEYNMILSNNPSMFNVTSIEMGWSGIILLFSPILTTINSVTSATSNVEVVSSILNLFIGYSISDKALQKFVGAWSLIGLLVMIAIGFLFLFLTARKIDAPGRAHGKKKSQNK